MCICINCCFYKTCWILKGLKKIPKNFVQSPLKFSNKKDFNDFQILNKSLFLIIILNSFSYKQKFEFDVVKCEAFCEQPGYWID
jgi:hypothetical protein